MASRAALEIEAQEDVCDAILETVWDLCESKMPAPHRDCGVGEHAELWSAWHRLFIGFSGWRACWERD
jgi:hypothetical protein